MTPAEVAAESRAAQGLPPHVEDPVALAKIVTLIRTSADQLERARAA